MPEFEFFVSAAGDPAATERRHEQLVGIAQWPNAGLAADWQERTVAWLKDKWKAPCPRCAATRWTIGDVLVADAVWGVPLKVLPKVTVTCLNCGDTSYINAYVAGVVTNVVPPAVVAAGEAPPTAAGDTA